MSLLQRFRQWRHDRAVQKYQAKPDKYIKDVIEPFDANMTRREAKLAERSNGFLLDHMDGTYHERRKP